MSFWDWKSGYRYQSLDTTAQPGSLDAEAGIMSSTFDRSGLRLICGEADKTSMSNYFRLCFMSANFANPSHSQNLETGRKRIRRDASYSMEPNTGEEEILDVYYKDQ